MNTLGFTSVISKFHVQLIGFLHEIWSEIKVTYQFVYDTPALATRLCTGQFISNTETSMPLSVSLHR